MKPPRQRLCPDPAVPRRNSRWSLIRYVNTLLFFFGWIPTFVFFQRNSILAGAGHASGWVNRVDEKEKIATTGENWRSQAFDVEGSSLKNPKEP